MVFGWLIPSLFVMSVAASLAELTSAMPYVPPHCRPLLSILQVYRHHIHI